MGAVLETTYRCHRWHQAVRPGRHWSQPVGACIGSMPQQRWQQLHDALRPRQCDKMRSWIISIAARHGDRGSWKHATEHAEVGGASSIEPCSCPSQAELRSQSASKLKRTSVRPAVQLLADHVLLLCCTSTVDRCHERLHGTSGNHGRPRTTIVATSAMPGICTPYRPFCMLGR